MSKPIVTDTRFDFRGGRNTAISPDLLNTNELVDMTNARISATYGAVTKRSGSQRVHQTALGAPSAITSLVQWDDPVSASKQIVAIASNGHLYYRNGFNYATAFTDEGSAQFNSVLPAFFTPFRAAAAGAPLVLFIANAGKLFKWTGAVLTRIDGTANAPTADRVIAYHTRLFARQSNLVKHVFWSKVGDGEYWTTGSKTDGGSAMIDVLNGEEITAMEVIGSSLLLASEDSVSRFTGHASDDIVIAQDTEGVTSEVGAIGPLCLKRFENVAALFTERGPYAVTETEAVPIAEQIGPDFANINPTYRFFSNVGWNRGRKELLFIFSNGEEVGLKTIFSQAVRLQAWQGPWTYPFSIRQIARYEDENGNESIIAGGGDGFIRTMDTGAKDDILYDGTGGSNISMTIEIPVIQFGKPGITKALHTMSVQANLPPGSNTKVRIAFDEGAFVDTDLGTTTGEDNIRVDLNGQGKRLYMQFVDDSDQIVGINGYILEGWDYGRP